MSKLKDLVIRHSAEIRQLQRTTIETISGALEIATSLPQLKTTIQEALDTLFSSPLTVRERI